MAKGARGVCDALGALTPARTSKCTFPDTPRGESMDLPELFVTGVDERGHFTFKGWRPPPVQDFATPADLARLIAAFRTWVKASPEPGFLPITEQGAI